MSLKIMIDPGHGGQDSGAVGPTRLKESDTVLIVSKKLGQLLTKNGFEVMYTRTGDTYPSLTSRCHQANTGKVNFFVSVHANSDGSTAVGIETLHHTNSSGGKALADRIQKELIARTGDRDRGLKPRNNLAVLNGTNMPAVLPEIGFISHPDTEKKFRQDSYLDIIADAIGRGIANYVGVSWNTAAPIPPVPIPPTPEEPEKEPDGPANIKFACPHCGKQILISFGPTGETDVEKL